MVFTIELFYCVSLVALAFSLLVAATCQRGSRAFTGSRQNNLDELLLSPPDVCGEKRRKTKKWYEVSKIFLKNPISRR